MASTSIRSIRARRVWDSRGRPTIEAEVALDSGAVGRAIAPAGASRGSREAIELRDGGARLGGLDVMRAIVNVNGLIAARLAGRDATDQAGIDAALCACDGTPDKSNLGANATVAVSMAAAHAAAAAAGVPLWRHLAGGRAVSLPLPEIQLIGGGAHASRRIDLQDLMIMPIGAWTFGDAIVMCAEVYRCAGQLLEAAGEFAGLADEGGYWPSFQTNAQALDFALRAIDKAGLRAGSDVALSLDVAASQLGSDGRYRLALEDRELDRDELCALWLEWLDRYPIASIEDPFAEDDRVGWIRFAQQAAARVQIIGDDYLVTDAARVADAARDGACNAVLVKPNQIGTLSEAHNALLEAQRNGFGTIVSARSGETEDVTIAHLAVGWNAGQIKVGSFARGERTAKWNELLRIEETLGSDGRFAGAAALPIQRDWHAVPVR